MIFVGILALGFYWCTMKTTTDTSATKASAAASHTTIVSPPRTDTVYIVGSFRTTHISIFHYWVAVISRLRQSQYKLATSPQLYAFLPCLRAKDMASRT